LVDDREALARTLWVATNHQPGPDILLRFAKVARALRRSAALRPIMVILRRRPPISRFPKPKTLFAKVRSGKAIATEEELFRAQMLTEMAQMSVEDGLVMQIHPVTTRNHNRVVYERYGRDKGADIPRDTNYVDALRPLLNRFGNEKGLTIILFTLDESTYSRELAPLAGHYPCLRLGPPWWFNDSPEGMMRFREQATETAGFYNTLGFNDDTHASLSIPARHDVARRIDCSFLAKLVADHRLRESEAMETARDLAVEEPLAPGARIGRVRWTICAMLFAATSVNYIDRQVISILKPTLDHSIGLTEVGYGFIVDAFQVAYALGLLAAGRFVDKIGTRIGYMVIMAIWSLSAMGHALASTAMEFGIARFSLGLGESGNFPAAIKTVAEWFPQRERALATGIFNSAANLGAILAPLIVPWITIHYGWHSAFLVTGCFSALWIFWWYRNYRKPADHPTLTGAELRFIYQEAAAQMGPSVSWSRLLLYRQIWAFAMAKFLTDPIWWFYLFWLPSFFSAKFHLDLSHFGLPLIVVYNASAVGSIRCGWLPEAFRRFGDSQSYARLGAMFLCACMVLPIFTLIHPQSVWMSAGVLSLAAAGHQGWSANLFTTTSDMFPHTAVGSMTGIGGMAGSAGGAFIATYAGHILQLTHSYASLFLIAGSAYLVALAILQLLAPGLKKADLSI